MKDRKCHNCGVFHQRLSRFCSDACSARIVGSLSESEWKAKMGAALMPRRDRSLMRLIDDAKRSGSLG